MATTDWMVGVDWEGKGFPAVQYSASDQTNDLRTWIPQHWDYDNISYEVSVGSPETIPIAPMPFGRDAIRYEMSSGSQLDIFRDSGVYQITTTNTRHYMVVYWYRMISQDTSGGANVTTPTLYSNSGATLKVTGAALGQSTTWTKASLTFQATASDNLEMRVTKNAALSTIIYEFSGFMVIEHTSAPSVPSGYNSGGSLDAYDNLYARGDVKYMEFEGGLRPYEVAAGEKKLGLILNNNHKRYSPDYTSSPLYGYMKPGRVVVVYATAAAMLRHQYTGYLDLIAPIPGKADAQTAKLTTTNLVSILNRHPVSQQQQEGKTIAGLIRTELLLFDERLGDLCDLNDTLQSDFTADYYGDNSQGEEETGMSLWTAFAELSEAEGGKLYIGKDGVVNLRARSWDVSAVANAADATYSNVGKLTYMPTASRITTRVSVKVYPRQVGASATTTLWTLRQSFVIPAGQTRRFRAKYRNNRVPCGAKDVAEPTGADYVTAGGSPVLTFTAGGEDAMIEIDNSAGVTDCTVSTMVIKGRTIQTDDPSELVYENDYLVSVYGYHDLRLDLKAFSDIEDAQDLIDYVFPTLSLERGEITSIQIMNEDNGTDNEGQLTFDVGDQLSISDTQLGISNLFYNIVGWKHQIDPQTRTHITTYYLEIALKQTFWVLGVSRLGLETRLGR